jgi:hypothetical protein
VWPQRFTLIPARTDDLGVIIGEERCRLELGGATVLTEARIVFRPHRFPSAEIEFPALDVPLGDWQRVTVYLESGFVIRDGMLDRVPATMPSRDRRYGHRIRQTEPMTFQHRGTATCIECLVYNLGRFGFGGGPNNGLEQLSLDIPAGWRAIIGPIPPEIRSNRELLKLLGTPWRRPTNFLTLTRVGAPASAEEIDEDMFLLRYFLSFAWGRQVGFALTQGFSQRGELTYAAPGITHVDPQTNPIARQPHWFSPSNAEVLAQILPGFWSRMADPYWKDPVDWAIYWWLSANSATQVSETSILASQAGLEAVAPAVLQHYCGLTAREANDLRRPAAEKIRIMLAALRIPRPIPGNLDELRAVASSRRWEDGPMALTKVRNALAHPSKGDTAGLAYEASQLGMWYLELVLLFLMGYEGNVFNRTVFRGAWFEQDAVPWAQ